MTARLREGLSSEIGCGEIKRMGRAEENFLSLSTKYGIIIMKIFFLMQFCFHQQISKITAGRVQTAVLLQRAQIKKNKEIP